MAYPEQNYGTITPNDFGFRASSGSWTGDTPDIIRLYAVVPYAECPGAWDVDGVARMRRTAFIAAVDTGASAEMVIDIAWLNPYGWGSPKEHMLRWESAGAQSAWVNIGEQSEYARLIAPTGIEFGIIEITIWNEHEAEEAADIYQLYAEQRGDLDYDETDTSAIRQTLEPMPATYLDTHYASSYHAMWGLVEGLNRCLYEDRHANCWPMWGRIPE